MTSNYIPIRDIGSIPERTPDSIALEKSFWKCFKKPLIYKVKGPCVALSVCPKTEDLITAASIRITSRSTGELSTERTICKLKDNIQTFAIRSDGRLLAVGTADGEIFIVERKSKNILRTLKIHKAAVKSLAFSLDKIHLISGSDDKTVCLWDISTGDLIWQSKNNSDLIRSVAISNSGNFFASGSYDHSVQIRTLATSKAIVKLDHGSPVEAITFFPNEKYMATAGLSSVKIWEINTSSSENEISAKLVKELIVHHKTISAVHVTSDSKYMITSSLDHSSKIIKIEDDSIAHQFKFKSAIVSMFISNDYHSIAYGLTGGEVVFLRFKPFGKLGSELPSKKFTEFYDQSTSENISFNILKSKNIRLHRVDKFLKLFRYGAALDVVVNLNRVDAFISIIGELLRRRGLIIALSGRNLSEIILIINMIARAIPNPKYQSLAIEAAFALIDVYGPTSHQSNSFKDSIRLLRDHLTDIISSCVVSLKLYGQLESISDILP